LISKVTGPAVAEEGMITTLYRYDCDILEIFFPCWFATTAYPYLLIIIMN